MYIATPLTMNSQCLRKPIPVSSGTNTFPLKIYNKFDILIRVWHMVLLDPTATAIYKCGSTDQVFGWLDG